VPVFRYVPEEIASALRLWDQHQQAEFPYRLREQEVAGVDMVMLDADVAGCIATWVSVGQLDQLRGEALEQCLTDLDRVLSNAQRPGRKAVLRAAQRTGDASASITPRSAGASAALKKGTYRFFCTVHPTITGTFKVT